MFSSSAYHERLATGDGPASHPKHTFNPAAKPFVCPSKRTGAMYGGDTAGDSNYTYDTARKPDVGFIGPTYVPVNTRIWSSVGRTSPDPVSPVQSQLPAGINPMCNGLLKMCMEPPAHHANCPANQASFGPILHPGGFLQLNLRDGIMVALTLNSLKVINKRMNIAISVSGDSTTVAMRHPNGIIYQYGAQVDIVACDAKKSNHFIRYARMWHKGISFTSDRCALIYLVDSAGTRTTSETITMDLEADYVNQVFYK
ncbi:AGAP007678-PA-like protein [Anopheles sinensis]|uniref:AGAP007678-PA-like protein n=1 Tax=Anopheles sinensis TaxID=74873 RepID=A0A084VF26_ANOSI|nr:AGAP007678-PA-like protein [Anopheles sinensis]